MEKVQAKKRTWRVIDLIEWGEDYFNKHSFEGPRQEIEWLLCDLLDCKRIDLYVKFEEIVPQSKLSTLNQWIKKRLNRMPLQYITGKTEFYGNRIFVDQEVLIPRPETERLVDIALEEMKTIVNPKILGPILICWAVSKLCVFVSFRLFCEENILSTVLKVFV